MRMWSLHPSHLDRQGLVAAWREALLAQAVLADRTTGYRHHPQLQRFRDTANPLETIGGYLWGLHGDAVARRYSFNEQKIIAAGVPADTASVPGGAAGVPADTASVPGGAAGVPAGLGMGAKLTVTQGQLDYEWAHLGEKLMRRSPDDGARWQHASPTPHPIFEVVPGGVEAWERP